MDDHSKLKMPKIGGNIKGDAKGTVEGGAEGEAGDNGQIDIGIHIGVSGKLNVDTPKVETGVYIKRKEESLTYSSSSSSSNTKKRELKENIGTDSYLPIQNPLLSGSGNSEGEVGGDAKGKSVGMNFKGALKGTLGGDAKAKGGVEHESKGEAKIEGKTKGIASISFTSDLGGPGVKLDIGGKK